MSVLIKDMEMPKSCVSCRLYKRLGCELEDLVTNAVQGCPLTEVPTLHGRLIDADALEDKLNGLFRMRDYDRIDFYNHAIADCLATVRNAPTIIEAEEGEKE